MKYIYVDYENFNKLDSLVEIKGKYFFFIGENQTKINSSLVYSTNGMDVTWVKIKGNGKNALDFHIAYYLSKNDFDKNVEHLILSKDTGFDPLIEHVKEKGINVGRITTLSEISSKYKQKDLGECEQIVKILKKRPERHRPKSLEKLKSYMKAQIRNLNDMDIEKIIEEMIKKNIINLSENSKLKYLV